VLARDGCNYITYDDLRPLLRAVLHNHPGLEFLTDTPEFQGRWGALLGWAGLGWAGAWQACAAVPVLVLVQGHHAAAQCMACDCAMPLRC
jgi:hypothetical protein